MIKKNSLINFYDYDCDYFIYLFILQMPGNQL